MLTDGDSYRSRYARTHSPVAVQAVRGGLKVPIGVTLRVVAKVTLLDEKCDLTDDGYTSRPVV